MPMGELPAAGQLRLGSVALPAGRRIVSLRSGEPVAWATVQDVPDAGRVWAALCDARQQTGLVPFLLAGLDGTARPWDSGELDFPADTAELDHMDAASVLAALWDGKTEDWEHVESIGATAPFSRQFPGLAPASEQQLDPGQIRGVLSSLPAARIGLVPATRPADVLPLIGWTPSDQSPDALPVAAILRSWEDRFGARLLEVGFEDLRLLVERPPHGFDATRRVAAEHYAFADECDGCGSVSYVAEIYRSLLDQPAVWQFWWD